MKAKLEVYHVFLFFSVKFAGGTSDLMYKLCKAQEKTGLQPVVVSGDHHFDDDLASSLPGVKFKIFKSYLDKAGFSLMPGLLKLFFQKKKACDVVHMHVFRTFQNLILYYYCKLKKIPYVIDAHGAVPFYVKKTP